MFPEAMFGMFIGLMSILGFFALVISIVLVSMRNRRLRMEALHKERMLALEKGLPVPMDYPDHRYSANLNLSSGSRRRPYVTGMVWAGVGLAIVIWGIIEGEADMNAWGLVPLFVGIALIIGDAIAARRERKADNGTAGFPGRDSGYQAPDNLT